MRPDLSSGPHLYITPTALVFRLRIALSSVWVLVAYHTYFRRFNILILKGVFNE